MLRSCFGRLSLVVLLLIVAPAAGQVRVTPQSAKGGTRFGEPWVGVPDPFQNLGVPDWQPPSGLAF